jgi:O-antigen ligase
MKKPILGYGPGTSAHARKLVNSNLVYIADSDLQTHNLYGQILAEAGLTGMFIFLLIVGFYLFKLQSVIHYVEGNPKLMNMRMALQNVLLLFLFYGMASHILYRYYWFMIFALHGAFIELVQQPRQQEQ